MPLSGSLTISTCQSTSSSRIKETVGGNVHHLSSAPSKMARLRCRPREVTFGSCGRSRRSSGAAMSSSPTAGARITPWSIPYGQPASRSSWHRVPIAELIWSVTEVSRPTPSSDSPRPWASRDGSAVSESRWVSGDRPRSILSAAGVVSVTRPIMRRRVLLRRSVGTPWLGYRIRSLASSAPSTRRRQTLVNFSLWALEYRRNKSNASSRLTPIPPKRSLLPAQWRSCCRERSGDGRLCARRP